MRRPRTIRHRLAPALLAWCLAAATAGAATAQTIEQREASLQAFARIAEVLRHPRCLNCHPSGDSPRQADDRHRHRMLVARGPDDRGTPALKCSTCHQTENTADGRVPGAPHWQLAPRSMGWEDLSDADLCRALTDPGKNKGRSVRALVEHMTADPLVQWAWSPGERTPPPIGQREFHALVRQWAQTGAACPR
jgi:hypothetical protein